MGTTVKFPPLEPDDLGTDVDVMDDFAPSWGLVSGRDNLGRAYYRRLNTPAGGLFYDATYGYDVKDLLNADLTTADISAARSGIKSQLMIDERTQSVDVVLTFDPTARTLGIAINAETNDGPFALILRATAVTLAVLEIDGVPVPPDITPDFIAADVAETPGAIVFPPSPPAVGSLSGQATISLSLAATAKQPVPDGWLFFSGNASNSGLAETHANRGATSSATPSTGVVYVPPACTMRSLRVQPLSNSRTVATSFTVFKNGVTTGLQVSVPAGSTTVTAPSSASVDFNGTTDTMSLISSGSPTGAIAFGATIDTGFVRFLKFSGTHSYDVAPSNTCYLSDVPGYAGASANGYIPPAYTAATLRVNVTSNKSMTRPLTITLYKNGSPTAMTVTIPAGTVGAFSDSSHGTAFNGSTDKLDLVTSRTGASPTTNTQVFDTVPGTWTKPADARTVEYVAYGAGGGAASAPLMGTAGSGGNSLGAGGGAGGGGVEKGTFDASSLAASYPVTPGAAGSGGSAGSALAGTDGGSSSFGTAVATGGRGGQPPSSGVGGAGGAGGTGNAGTGGSGGNGGGSGAGSAGGAGTGLAPGGGGGGGGANQPGGAGGTGGGLAAGGAGGSAPGSSGADGTDRTGVSNIEQRAGGGGGGGYGAIGNTTAAGNGGAGGGYGAGGAGGGGAAGNASGGAGQRGGKGGVIVQTTIIPGDIVITATLELA